MLPEIKNEERYKKTCNLLIQDSNNKFFPESDTDIKHSILEVASSKNKKTMIFTTRKKEWYKISMLHNIRLHCSSYGVINYDYKSIESRIFKVISGFDIVVFDNFYTNNSQRKRKILGIFVSNLRDCGITTYILTNSNEEHYPENLKGGTYELQ